MSKTNHNHSPKTNNNSPNTVKSFWKSLGPGIVTGAADDDPSGIATYSQAGAQMGMSILWTMPITWPLMSAIQMVSAQIGRVTGKGLAANIRTHYGRPLTFSIMALIFCANVFNLGADISAMCAAANLLFGGEPHIFAVVLALISVVLQVLVPYHKYASILKYLTFVLFAYVGVMFFVHVNVAEVLRGTFIPKVQWDERYITTFIAVLGTTISPYLFFWQSSQEVEEIRTHRFEHPLKQHPEEAPTTLSVMRNDTLLGMAWSNIVAYFIILATATTLHAHNITQIQTASQAAEALRPLAGDLCFLLFSIGILGTGMLGLPVLAGSAAFAVGEGFKFPASLEKKPANAKRFYGVIVFATLLGLVITYSGISAIQALYWSAVINGLISAPIMVVVMILASRPKVMGQFTISLIWKILGWLGTILMIGAAIMCFVML